MQGSCCPVWDMQHIYIYSANSPLYMNTLTPCGLQCAISNLCACKHIYTCCNLVHTQATIAKSYSRPAHFSIQQLHTTDLNDIQKVL